MAVKAIPFVQARNYTKGRSNKIDVLVIHTMETPENHDTAESVANWFAGSSAPRASAHYCLTPETRVLGADLTWRPIGELHEGTTLLATQESAGPEGRSLTETPLIQTQRRDAECLRITVTDGRLLTCSLDHRWLGKRAHRIGQAWQWLAAEELRVGDVLSAPLRVWEEEDTKELGYLQGIFDGEGCWQTGGIVSFAQKDGPVLTRTLDILDRVGIAHQVSEQRDNGVCVVKTSGLQAALQLLGSARPERLMSDPRWLGRGLRSRLYSGAAMIADVEYVGSHEVVSVETGTHTFFAEGVVSHNCIDDNSIVQCVHDADVAWHAPGANHNGLGFEHAGRAAQTKADWSDDYSTKLLELSAGLVAKKCEENHIPVVWLLPADLRAGKRGITGHVQVSEAFKLSTHTDPGKNFPVQRYLALVRTHMGDAHVPESDHRGRHKAPSQNPTLKQGAEGYQVKRLQRLLALRGFDPGAADGVFGAATTKAVKKAQKENGLAADGIAGPLTWHALLAGWPT